jgi:MoxR-like ATPase
MPQRAKVGEIYKFIDTHLYYNLGDFNIKGRRYNTTLLFSILTSLVPGKLLILGEPGMGKTTASEYVACIFFSYPLELIWQAELHGHSEQTEEKMIGRPNLGKLNQGREEVVWSVFTQLPVKIVDEINRVPASKQDILLDGIDRGLWSYLDEVLINSERCFFATANYTEGRSLDLTYRLVDRFDLLVESRFPGAILSYEVGDTRKMADQLRHGDLAQLAFEILRQDRPYAENLAQLHDEVSAPYRASLKQTLGVEAPNDEERDSIRQEIAAVRLNADAEAFVVMLIAELSFCYRFGQKRFHEECDRGCHYTTYLCSRIRNSVSNRFSQSLLAYARALAWFLEDEEADMEHVAAVAPYALAHRLRWREQVVLAALQEQRQDPIEIHLARESVEEVASRYREQSATVKSSFRKAWELMEGFPSEWSPGDHPLYQELRKVVDHH